MKKYLFFLLLSFGVLFKAEATKPEDCPGRTIKIVNVEKADGRRSFLGIFGEVRYNEVRCTSSVKYITNPETGQADRVIITNYYCEGPGNEKCRHTGGISIQESTTSNHNDVEEYTDMIINSMLDSIDKQILDKDCFKGSISKKYMFTSKKDENYFYSVKARWYNGNKKGDAKITVIVHDVTESVSKILY